MCRRYETFVEKINKTISRAVGTKLIKAALAQMHRDEFTHPICASLDHPLCRMRQRGSKKNLILPIRPNISK